MGDVFIRDAAHKITTYAQTDQISFSLSEKDIWSVRAKIFFQFLMQELKNKILNLKGKYKTNLKKSLIVGLTS